MVLFVAAAILLLGGCTDLDEINQFAKASQDVGKAFPGLADGAAASCTRANTFINARVPLTPLPCEIYPALNPSIVKVNAALFNYIASLGKLASDDLSKVPGGLSNLSSDLKQGDPGISAADQAKAAAAGGLASAITSIWANGYRQRELSKIINDNNKAVQDVAEFLSAYAADKYLLSLKHESDYEGVYCGNMASAAEPVATDLLNKKCAEDLANIALQKTALQSYQKALKTVAETHQKLYNDRGHWDAKKLAIDLGPEIVALGNAAVAVNKAF